MQDVPSQLVHQPCQEEKPPEVSFQVSLAEAMHVQELRNVGPGFMQTLADKTRDHQSSPHFLGMPPI